MSIPEHIRYVAIEGTIGVGKTSLAQMLLERWSPQFADSCGISFLEEKFDNNPFLEKFYTHPDEYAFQTQLFFLISRLQELKNNVSQNEMFRPLLVSDYTFDKDRIFAAQNLTDAEFSMYDTVSKSLSVDLPTPDYIIYLQAGVDTLLSRIRHRNREMERNIQGDYLLNLQQRFDHHFWHYSACPVMIINTDRIDFVHYPEHFENLATMIETWPASTTYYAPEGK
jgi:deoxyadenosine/deoxycytidine kinase